MGKKGINLSFEMIVVGIIAILVLIVAIVFFTGAFKDIGGQIGKLNECENRPGSWECKNSEEKKNYQQCIPIGCKDNTNRWCCTNE